MSIVKVSANNSIIQRPYTLTLDYGDYINGGSRSQLRDSLTYPVGSFYTFDLELTLTNGWTLDHPIRLNQIICQWRNGDGSPYTQIRVEGARWELVVNGQVFDLRQAVVGRLEKFKIRIGFGDHKITLDGVDVYKGQTIWPNISTPTQFSCEIYRPWWNSNPLYEGEKCYRQMDVNILGVWS